MSHEPPTRDTLELVRLAKAGDSQATAILVRRYWGLMEGHLAVRFSTLRGEGARPQREDLLQEAWLKMVRPGGGLDSYDPSRGSFDSWLLTVLDRVVTDQYRRQSTLKRGRPLLGSDASLEEGAAGSTLPPGLAPGAFPQQSPEWGTAHRLLLDAILRCLQLALSPRDWLLFGLIFVEERMVAEVALAVGATVGRVYKRLEVIQKRANSCREAYEGEKQED